MNNVSPDSERFENVVRFAMADKTHGVSLKFMGLRHTRCVLLNILTWPNVKSKVRR